MTIWAIFLCMQATGACRPVEYSPPITYPTRKACEAAIKPYAVGESRDPNGRYYVGAKESGIWYECRHRHVDTWEQ